MTKILLTRHGHVEGIDPERFRGRQQLELTERGRREAAAVAARIAGAWRPVKIYTSPMTRCVDTGAAIAQTTGAPAEVCADLNDIDYGAWQFRTFDAAKADEPALYATWLATPEFIRFPDGEALQDLAARAANVLRFVLARHPEDTIVLVGHDSVNRALLMQCLAMPLSAYRRIAQNPCCLNEIDIVGGTIRVVRINETLHLDAPTPGQ